MDIKVIINELNKLFLNNQSVIKYINPEEMPDYFDFSLGEKK